MFSRLASLLTAIAVEPREKSHSGHAPALELRATRVMFKIGSLADFFSRVRTRYTRPILPPGCGGFWILLSVGYVRSESTSD